MNMTQAATSAVFLTHCPTPSAAEQAIQNLLATGTMDGAISYGTTAWACLQWDVPGTLCCKERRSVLEYLDWAYRSNLSERFTKFLTRENLIAKGIDSIYQAFTVTFEQTLQE